MQGTLPPYLYTFMAQCQTQELLFLKKYQLFSVTCGFSFVQEVNESNPVSYYIEWSSIWSLFVLQNKFFIHSLWKNKKVIKQNIFNLWADNFSYESNVL